MVQDRDEGGVLGICELGRLEHHGARDRRKKRDGER